MIRGAPAAPWYTRPPMRTAPDPRLGTKSIGTNVLEHDRPCGSCGYNLKGLAPGGVCPECGAPIRARTSSSEAAPELLEAPRWRVLAIAAGCFGLIGVVIFKYILIVAMSMARASALWTNAMLACVGVAWVVGVVLVTLPRPGRPEMKWMEVLEFSTRWAARLLAVFVPLTYLCSVGAEIAQAQATAAATPFNAKPWEIAKACAGVAQWVSFLPLIWAVSNLALSCADHAMAWRTRVAIACLLWTYLMYGVMAWVRTGGANAGAGVFGMIGVVTWAVGWLIVLIGLGQIGSMMLWAVRYNDGAAERERRRIDREREDRERFPVPVPVSPIGPGRPVVTRPKAQRAEGQPPRA